MKIVLHVYDERRPGAERELRHQLDLPVDSITARDLIRCRIQTEVALWNAGERARFDGETPASGRQAQNQWLVTPGAVEQALNGPRDAYGPRQGLKRPEPMTLIDSEPLIAAALEAFARNGFFMIFDGRQITDLNEVLAVEHNSTLTFLRLVPLVGG